jgi:hypothetical protein
MSRSQAAFRPPEMAYAAAATSSSAGDSSAAPWRIRWSKADRAALAPSPAAMMICLNGVVVASPAPKTPAALVAPRQSMTISPCGDYSTVPRSHSVLGTRPI